MVEQPIDTEPVPDLADGIPGDELPPEVEPDEEEPA